MGSCRCSWFPGQHHVALHLGPGKQLRRRPHPRAGAEEGPRLHHRLLRPDAVGAHHEQAGRGPDARGLHVPVAARGRLHHGLVGPRHNCHHPDREAARWALPPLLLVLLPRREGGPQAHRSRGRALVLGVEEPPLQLHRGVPLGKRDHPGLWPRGTLPAPLLALVGRALGLPHVEGRGQPLDGAARVPLDVPRRGHPCVADGPFAGGGELLLRRGGRCLFAAARLQSEDLDLHARAG
mmetsp:Transcript_133624/g.415566  ORF Transcript_133624/g.415566 Transcript_133624/m.415566 type:complete len:237 (-) Transcript_133624:1161-1871(-)